MARRKRPDPEPVQVNAVKLIAVGTALWLAAFLALLPFYGRLADSGRASWLWTCLAGFGLGLLGMEYCRRRRTTDRRPASHDAPEHPHVHDGDGPGAAG